MPKVSIGSLNIRMRGVSQKRALSLIDGLPQSILKHVQLSLNNRRGIHHIPEMHIQPQSVSAKICPREFQHRTVTEISRNLNKQLNSKP